MLLGELFSGSAHQEPSRLVLAGLLASCLVVCAPGAQADTQSRPVTKSQPAAASKAQLPGPQVIARSQRGEMWYTARFGVDQMQVHYTASGASLEFRFRVVDPDKAAVLTDKRAAPYLIDELTGTRLEVPVMEKIGALRQTAAPEKGREYWMLFANRGKLVKPGRRVDIHAGPFHVRGLTVE